MPDPIILEKNGNFMRFPWQWTSVNWFPQNSIVEAKLEIRRIFHPYLCCSEAGRWGIFGFPFFITMWSCAADVGAPQVQWSWTWDCLSFTSPAPAGTIHNWGCHATAPTPTTARECPRKDWLPTREFILSSKLLILFLLKNSIPSSQSLFSENI